MQPELKVHFPFVKYFSDYNGGVMFADDLNSIFKQKIRYHDFSFDGNYYFVFYIGKKPNKTKIIEAMRRQGASVDEIEGLAWR